MKANIKKQVVVQQIPPVKNLLTGNQEFKNPGPEVPTYVMSSIVKKQTYQTGHTSQTSKASSFIQVLLDGNVPSGICPRTVGWVVSLCVSHGLPVVLRHRVRVVAVPVHEGAHCGVEPHSQHRRRAEGEEEVPHGAGLRLGEGVRAVVVVRARLGLGAHG